MDKRQTGFVRASALGPIGQVIEANGGRVARVLAAVDLPYAILEQPDLIVPLREQFKLLTSAARELGDEFFGARLGCAAKAIDLGPYGVWVCSAPTLGEAIGRAGRTLNAMLQTATVLRLSIDGGQARWAVEFLEAQCEGRHQNEALALGYMLDLLGLYLGPRWRPTSVITALPRETRRGPMEQLFQSNVVHGGHCPTIVFQADALRQARPMTAPGLYRQEERLLFPERWGLCDAVVAMIDLAMAEGYPRIEWVAGKLGMTKRSLQRRLREEGTDFSRILEACLRRRACALLREVGLGVTDVAFRLGYEDAAHFTRAFRRWTGVSPRAYRLRQNGLN